jgi:signal transduction histidine kinase/DNA-binding NarL/FixJ family response regulator
MSLKEQDRNSVNSRESLAGTTTLRILLVEDNPGDVYIISNYLKATNINLVLTKASTLSESLLLCMDHSFDVILLDLGLPDSFGLDTLRKMQVFRVIPPVVVMTGLDDEDIALASLREGAQDYLVKNLLNPEIILRSIKYSIERKKLQNLQEKNAQQFSILSRATSALNESEDISMIFTIISESIKNLLIKSNVLTFELSSNLIFRPSNIDWIEPWFERIKAIAGLDLREQVFNISDHRQELIELIGDGKLHELKDGLREILPVDTDPENIKKLQKTIGKHNIYTIGLIRNKNLYGGAIIFASSVIEDDDKKIIETICNQATLSIYRRLIEKNLRLSELCFKELNSELEQKIKERTEDLESANQKMMRELRERNLAEEALLKSEAKLIELNATKDKFFNIVAHDLKNPFTSLLGSTELLYENIHKMDTQTIKKLAQILNESAKSGYSILLNLLDWSRSQTGQIKFNPERINLKNLIDENFSEFYLFSTNKSITMISDVNDDIYIFADRNMLNTVLRNLLSNAVKFTHRNGSIHVKAMINSNEVVISVEDTGIGISKSNINKLFRLDTKYSVPGTDKETGTGLGLKLCKEFIEKMNGSIYVKSVENKGSEFIFSIPVTDKVI